MTVESGTPKSDPLLALGLRADTSGQIGLDLMRMPSDHVGASTAGNYHYQDEIAASMCVCMLTEQSITAVICEWDEDLIVVRAEADAQYELVSVKHHEREHYTTLNQLCTVGGLAHLFDRWLGYRTTTRARLCSNARLAGKQSEASPRALETICNSRSVATDSATNVVCQLAWAMMDAVKDIDPDDDRFLFLPRPLQRSLPTKPYRNTAVGLPDGLFDNLVRFLLLLRFDCGRPDKPYIGDTNIRKLVEPAMPLIGLRPAAAPSAYKAVLELVSEASRDRSGQPRDLARHLADPDAETADTKILETLDRRTVTREQVLAAMRGGAAKASDGVSLLRSGTVLPRSAGGHKLREKMSVADIEAEEQENAQELRDLWLNTWPQIRTGFTEDVETEFRLQLQILEIVREVHIQLIAIPDPFGVRFQAELHKALLHARLAGNLALALDDFHIIGFAYELSDRCRFGFVRRGGTR